MSEKPLVSIVLPVHNGARFLRTSIQSCLEQTYRDIELIVVDDGSRDESVEIVKSYSDDRLKLICHRVNRKTPAALNTGFKLASGTYLTWTSDDNFYIPTAIEKMVQFLQDNPQIRFVVADEYWIDESGQVTREFESGPFDRLIEWNCLSGAFLYTREVYEKIGDYDENAFMAEDYDYFLRISAHFTLGHLNLPVYYYRHYPESLTGRFGEDKGMEVTLAVKRKIFGKNLWKNRMLLHRAHVDAAFRFHERGNRPAAARALFRGIKFDPKCLFDYEIFALTTRVTVGRTTFELLKRLKQRTVGIARGHN